MATEKESALLKDICDICPDVNPETLQAVVTLAVELAREGREGRKIGTMFIVSDSDEVLMRSRPMILDPLALHPAEQKHINDPNVRETLKELAQLDGAFVISGDGIVLSAARHINSSSVGVELPMGLGSRHMAAASITRETRAVAVVVSESSIVRIFDKGKIVSEIIPELWLIRHQSPHISGPYSTRNAEDMTIRKTDENKQR
jgi:diadenylate cyclase